MSCSLMQMRTCGKGGGAGRLAVQVDAGEQGTRRVLWMLCEHGTRRVRWVAGEQGTRRVRWVAGEQGTRRVRWVAGEHGHAAGAMGGGRAWARGGCDG